MEELIKNILHNLGINHTAGYVKNLVKTQPYGDSLYAISFILGKYNIDTNGVRIANKDSSLQYACPFICHIKQQWIYVCKIKDETVYYYSDSSTKRHANIPIVTFVSMWDGTALLIEKTKYSEEPDLNKHKSYERNNKIRTILIVLSIIGISLASLLHSPLKHSYILYIQLVINFIGVYICTLLLQTQINIQGKTATKICGLIKGSHCGNLIKSDNHKILGFISLGEIGYGYFVANVICLLLIPSSIFWLAIFSICALPFTLWSVWYQKFKAKEWCALCLVTLAIIWIQASTFLIGEFFRIPATLFPGIITLALYTLIICMTNIMMERFSDRQNIEQLRAEKEVLKSDPHIIQTFTSKNPVMEITDDNCSALVFGNVDAKNTLTIFSNPYCNPCAHTHSKINGYLNSNLNIRYVLSAFSESLAVINKYIIASYIQLGADATWELLTEWFATGKSQGETFFEKFNLDIQTPEVNTEFEKHNAWIIKNMPKGTPTDYINGKEITWPYTPEDYQYLI